MTTDVQRLATTTMAWTLGFPPAYEVAVRMAGNGKAPGGYIFRSRRAALMFRAAHPDAQRYRPYRVVLPDVYERCVTRDYGAAVTARHLWHEREVGIAFMPQCGVCLPCPTMYDHDVLLVVAPFINPDTGDIS